MRIGEDLISSMFRIPVAVSIATHDKQFGALHDVEERAIRDARPKRRSDFTAGRTCARKALNKLGHGETPIPTDAQGVPCWPAGFLGSISHCDGFCAAVVARSDDALGLGIDAENAEPVDSGLADFIAEPHEYDVSGAPLPGKTTWLNIIFSAKEAFYKAYYPSVREFLEFRDVEINVSPGKDGLSTFEARVSNPRKRKGPDNAIFEGYWAVVGGLVICTASFRKRSA